MIGSGAELAKEYLQLQALIGGVVDPNDAKPSDTGHDHPGQQHQPRRDQPPPTTPTLGEGDLHPRLALVVSSSRRLDEVARRSSTLLASQPPGAPTQQTTNRAHTPTIDQTRPA